MTTQIQATGTGTSGLSVQLPPGEFLLSFFSAGAFTLDVQVGDGTNFHDLYYDATTKVTINSGSGPRHVKVPGGLFYRMDVDTYNEPITMNIVRSSGQSQAAGVLGKL